MFKKILVPLDGSTVSEEALPLAAHVACVSNGELFLLHIVPSSTVPLYPGTPTDIVAPMKEHVFTNVQTYLDHAIAHAHLDTLNVQTEILVGEAVSTIIKTAVAHKVDLIILRSHGKTGLSRWLTGNTAHHLVRNSPVPVLVLKDTPNKPEAYMHRPRILVALDGSAFAETALLPAAQLSETLAFPRQGTIHLTYVVEKLTSNGYRTHAQAAQLNRDARAQAEDYLTRMQERFLTGDLSPYLLEVTTSVVSYTDVDDITKRIVEESSCIGDVLGFTGCDMIAMATHGRHGFQHLLLGSFTEGVLDTAQQPLLIVHPSKMETRESASLSQDSLLTS